MIFIMSKVPVPVVAYQTSDLILYTAKQEISRPLLTVGSDAAGKVQQVCTYSPEGGGGGSICMQTP